MPLVSVHPTGRPFLEPERRLTFVAGLRYEAAQSNYSPCQALNVFNV